VLHRHSDAHVEVEFSGTLSGRAVIWHAEIRTLRDDCSMQHQANPATQAIHAKQFIEIEDHARTPRLRVGLNLPCIDDAAILRTIIMIRQYKRLRPGRHEYGDTAIFKFEQNNN
jgi:hypothetical protein